MAAVYGSPGGDSIAPMDPRAADRDLLARLLATEPVTNRPNAAIVEVLERHLDRPGVRVERVPAHAPDRWNLVAAAGPPVDAERRGLVLSGHLDVVPPGEGWTTPPFELTDRDGLWYGRGSCDMLGFVAMAANLLVRAGAGAQGGSAGTGTGIAEPLVLMLTADEEIGSLGAAALVEHWPSDRPLPRAAVVGEPTGLRVVRMHKGHAKRRFVLRGRSAHSGTPQLGRSAIEAVGPVLGRLAALRDELAGEGGPEADRFPSAPYPVLTVGRLVGGEAVNMVAETCAIELGVRVLPGQRAADLLARVREAVAAGVADDDRRLAAAAGDAAIAAIPPITVSESDLGDNPPLGTPRSAPIVARLMDAIGQREDVGVSFASDGGHLAGGLGMDPVLFGPGHMRVAHRPDEHLDPAELDRARTTIAALAGIGGAPETAATSTEQPR
jgi:acetylornithine deacetylase